MTLLQSRLPRGSSVLDLGCGPRDQAVSLEHLGFQYIGVDWSGDAADLLADAHRLPFADGSFDAVFSYAVLEHLHSPYVALCEIARVLKPGGLFLGDVSQGEPFHDSYFHVTPWGLVALLKVVPDLRIVRLWPSADTLVALSRIGRYPRVVRLLLRGLAVLHHKAPFLAPRRMKWPASERWIDDLYRAGSVCFLIQKGTPAKGPTE